MRGRIRPRGSGTWQLVVDAAPDPITGARRQIYRTVKGSKRKASEELAHLVLELGRGDHNGHDATVAELVAIHMQQAELSPTTRDDYERVIRQHLPAPFGATAVWKVRPADVDALYHGLRAAGVSANRIHRLHNVLSVAFVRAVKWGWVARSPIRDASPPSIPRRDLEPPGADDLNRLLDAAEGDFKVFLQLAVLSGARRGELCALRWKDIDGRSLAIRRAVVYTPASGVVVKETKTGKVRTIALDDTTTADLERHRLTARAKCLALGEPLQPDAFVFARDALGREPWRPDFATYQYGELRAKVGVKTRLHDLRHAHATQLLAAGLDLRTIANRLGHARTSTTADIYAAALPARDRAAADAMAALLGRPVSLGDGLTPG